MEASAAADRAEVYRHLHGNQMTGQMAKDLHSAKQILGAYTERHQLGSVLDVGCGLGVWMKAAQELGALSVHGIEGPWLDVALVEPDKISTFDLHSGEFNLITKFDTVISIEVAEHLPAEAASTFVSSLVHHAAGRIIFSAAIPGQGGHGHINERWPSYWIEKFAAHGYRCADFIRPAVWADSSIHHYLRQNVLVFTRNALEETHGVVDMVHPELWAHISGLYEGLYGAADQLGMIKRTVGEDGRYEIYIGPATT